MFEFPRGYYRSKWVVINLGIHTIRDITVRDMIIDLQNGSHENSAKKLVPR